MKRLLCGLVAVGLLAGCGGTAAQTGGTPAQTQRSTKPSPKPKPAPQVFTAIGSVTVPIDITSVLKAKSPTIGVTPCKAQSGGYDDIHAGAQVTVRDADGKTVALGTLDSGLLAGKPGTLLILSKCSFSFSITDVPSGGDFYSVEVAHRGQVNYSAVQMQSALKLTLGT